MTVATEALFDKIDAIIEPAGLVYHQGMSEVSGEETWTRWNHVAKRETIVSLNTDATPYVEVGFYDEDSNRIFSSKFDVGSENAWPFFVNTLKQAVQG